MQLLFPKEEEIMYSIWALGHPCVISEILNNNPLHKRNTVAKDLLLLEKKGYIKTDFVKKTATRYGRAYSPVVSQKEYEDQKNLFSAVEQSKTAETGILAFMSSLVDSNAADEQFIHEMDNLIEKYKANTRDE